MTEIEYLASKLSTAELAKLRQEIDTQVAAAVKEERARVRKLLAGPVLAAVRCIPERQIYAVGVDYDGAAVRSDLQAAYRAIRIGEQPQAGQS
ncbi:hypothetical protein [Actinoplanes regularis]|uniref:Uncharacterized protein n=1 Tax=Actinoplanes regularis TaxID=52697 RepID=A0A238WRU7_9ACTN|nr:hypothetical protein [Actinoplanes regularis]GIE84586.1 hypothetical protein Are01nite_10660 [Actinoplanes regularis]SNR49043.1 hypothetical protein SAMN06264365_102826 [Actinoplanes regularis]